MDLMWLTVLATVLVCDLVTSRKCGICFCSPTMDVVVCTGKGFQIAPEIPLDARQKAKSLGLQRNRIQLMTLDYLKWFEALEVVNISDQDVATRCLHVDFDAKVQTFKVLGEWVRTYNIFKKNKRPGIGFCTILNRV